MEFNGSNLLLLKSSPIIATADNNGDGGNITINTQFLIGENSNITANAFEGRGGNINITATGIYLDRNSTITASSEYGEDGIVETNTPAIDPTRGILNFSSDVVDAADLIANTFCEKSKGSDYVVTGKGGIPTTPHQDSGDDGVWVDLVEPVSSPHPRGDKTRNTGGEGEQGSSSSKGLSSRDIVPARGWIINAQGKGIFVGYNPTLVNSERGEREIVCEGDTANFD
jgi:large exoprotein involved in heme utilization and adhesion